MTQYRSSKWARKKPDYCMLLIIHLLPTKASHLKKHITLSAFLAVDACLTADPGVASLIPVWSHTFMEIDHEIISTVIHLPFADSFKNKLLSVTSESMVHKVLVNCLFKLAQEKSVVRRNSPDMTIAVSCVVKQQTNQPFLHWKPLFV